MFSRKRQQQRNERILRGLPPEPTFPEQTPEAISQWSRELVQNGGYLSPLHKGFEVGPRQHVEMVCKGGRLMAVPNDVTWPNFTGTIDGLALWIGPKGGRSLVAPVSPALAHAGDLTFVLADFTITYRQE